MAESYSVNAQAKYTDESQAWEAIRILIECVEHVQPGGAPLQQGIEMSSGPRRWRRESLRELAVIRAQYDLEYPAIGWDYILPGLHWDVRGYMFDERDQAVEVSAYAGVSYAKTEDAMRTVLARAKERGVELKMGSMQISVDEDERSGNVPEIQINHSPMKRWKMFRAWVGPHLAAYVIATAAAVTAGWLLIRMGLGA
ncbi:hypothetical protein [Microbacterium arabinogalactanolyticum]|uniref:hypothetical protein n=1 Tax=Microbacterium arabinogalactanolyticum TaxID=69365 RepID=UPI00255352B1|nr:hypothetical protein [Microbacterium arabinogalactanolyticum]GLC84505.1 hypothetical protein MIAR_10930 [Microbacterium arabinogalactanolyticum]